MHQPAYQMKAPYSWNALYRGGQEMATTKLRNQLIAVTIPIPGSVSSNDYILDCIEPLVDWV